MNSPVSLPPNTAQSTSSWEIFLSLPLEIWRFGICSFASEYTLQQWRLISKYFRLRIVYFPLIKQSIPFHLMKEYEEKWKHFGWPAECCQISKLIVSGKYVKPSSEEIIKDMIRNIPQSVTEIRFWGSVSDK